MRSLLNVEAARFFLSLRRSLPNRSPLGDDALPSGMLRPVLLALALLTAGALPAAERPRLAVLTDIGGDPDDQQSLVRLMVYANEFQIEALIASASGTRGELKKSIVQPNLIREIVETYGRVLPHLKRHAEGWPSAEDLL
jgi:hypothetical protein